MDFGVLTILIFVGLLGVAVYFCCRVKKTPGHVFSRDNANGTQVTNFNTGASPTQYVVQTMSFPQQAYAVGAYPVSPNGTPYPVGLVQANNTPYPVVGGGGMPLPQSPVNHNRLVQASSPYFDQSGGNAPSAPPPAADDLPPPYESVVSQRFP